MQELAHTNPNKNNIALAINQPKMSYARDKQIQKHPHVQNKTIRNGTIEYKTYNDITTHNICERRSYDHTIRYSSLF